ncbi:MAG: hypothetical protein QXL00_05585, partial [Conexivisphaerales archaeon]
APRKGDSKEEGERNEGLRRLRLKEELQPAWLGIEPAINLRENTVTNSEGSYARKREVLLQHRLVREGWKRAKEYGGWWIYSSLYQEGDSVSSRRFLAQKAGLSLKVLLYSKFQSM